MKKSFLPWLSLLAFLAGGVSASAQNQSTTIYERSAPGSGVSTRDEAGRISMILGVQGDVSARLKAVHSLGSDLKESEIRTLCGFVKAQPNAREKNLPALQLIKNDVLNALMEQTSPSPQLTGTLIETCRDPGQDSVTRDYVLQHLAIWYGRGALDNNERERIRAVLWEAAGTDAGMAGTALLGIHRLAECDSAFHREEIKRRAVAMAGGAQTALVSRITALQVCAEEGAVEALPLIRSLARAQSPTALRISAVAALGQLGGAQDILLLGRMEADPDPGLQTAVAAALRRLRQEFRLQKVA